MYATGDLTERPPTADEDPIERELREIEDLRERAMQSRDLIYCSPTVQHLVQKEIPRLLEVIRELRHGVQGTSGVDAVWIRRAVSELHREIEVVRDLVERR